MFKDDLRDDDGGDCTSEPITKKAKLSYESS